MLCESCHVDIPPAWKACLLSNTCPACSGCIMSEETKGLMNELKEAMLKMPNDPEGLAGWLVANYKLTKVGTAEPTKFYGKAKRLKAPKVKLNKSAISSHDKKMQEMVNLINQSSEEDENLEEEELEDEEDLEENYEDEDYEEEEEILRLEQEAKRKQRKKKANNSLIVPVEGVEPGPVDVEELSELLAQGSHTNNANMDRMLRLAKQQHLAENLSSGGVGIIKRAK